MIRSSMRVVETTLDREKRLAFKAQLAQRLDAPVQPTQSSTPESGFSVGQRVWHPDLGACSILAVDVEKNSIQIEVEGRGDTFDLILSQVIGKLGPVPVKKASNDTAFIGEVIDRDLKPMVADARIARDPKSVVRPEEQSNLAGYIAGDHFWHPELGVSQVVSFDRKQNEIVLDTSSGRVSLVFSQVQSKLTPIADTNFEHVPVKPLVREPIQKATQKPELRSVSVVLPEAFKSWQTKDQFLYLTSNQRLTMDEANDAYDAFNNKKTARQVEIRWVDHEPVSVDSAPAPVAPAPAPDGSDLVGQKVWHQDFGECTVLSVTKTDIVLGTERGEFSFVSNITLPKLVPLADKPVVEHATKQLGSKASEPKTATPRVSKDLVVSVPEGFGSWREQDQFLFLNSTKKLPPEEARDVITVLQGKSPVTLASVSVTEDDAPIVTPSPFREVEEAQAEEVHPHSVPDSLSQAGVHRQVETVEVVKKEVVSELRTLSVLLPKVFGSWKPSEQYRFLTGNKNLVPDEANDVIAVFNGQRPFNTKTQYEVLVDD